jgi:hypothetical protein
MNKIAVITGVCLLVLNLDALADFTFGVIPDTQTMAEKETGEAQVAEMLKFFVDKKEELNLVFVASLGDMTENTNDEEWGKIESAYQQFFDAGIPFAPCQGNHDTSDGINKFFPVSKFENSVTWGGSLNDKIENAYYLFSAEGMDFVLVVFNDWEYNADNGEDIEWANSVFERYPERRGIFAAHWVEEGDKKEQQILLKHDNIFMSVSGHRVPPREQHWTTTSPNGSTQNHMETDYQFDENDGATVRYYTFKPEEDQVCAFTYNVPGAVYETDDDSEFCFVYDMDPQ